MSQPNPFMRGTGRAITGVVIISAAVVAVAGLGTFKLPHITTEPLSIEVDTVNNAKRALVCQGGFGWLGADTERSSSVIPTGTPESVQFGAEPEALTHNEGAPEAAPQKFTADAGQPFAGAQSISFDSEDLFGLATASCTQPLADQWIVGGTTTLGASSAVTVANPGQRPATVTVQVVTEDGTADGSERRGVLVPAGEARSLSINGLAPESEALAVHVVSTGSAVVASLSTSTSVNILPQGLDTVTAQASPRKTLVFPAMRSIARDTNTDAEAHIGDRVRLLNTADTDGAATVTALTAKGEERRVAQVNVPAGKVTELPIDMLGEDVTAVTVTSDRPLVGSGISYNTTAGNTDYAWFAAAPRIDADEQTPLTIVKDGTLVLVNPGPQRAVVRLSDAADSSKRQTVQVGPHAAVEVKDPRAARLILESDRELYAGVRAVAGANFSAYPVITVDQRAETLRVYPK